MIQLAETGQTVSISGLGPWPKLASAAWFREHQGGRILSNIKRCVIPAAPNSWITALERYGTMSFAEVAAAAIRFGREGFGAQSISAEIIGESVASISQWPQNAAIYPPNGRPPVAGQRFFQIDLANSIQYMSGSGESHERRPFGWAACRTRRVLSRRHRTQNRRLPQGERRLRFGKTIFRNSMSMSKRRSRCGLATSRCTAAGHGAGTGAVANVTYP